MTGRTAFGLFSRKLCFLMLINWSSPTPLLGNTFQRTPGACFAIQVGISSLFREEGRARTIASGLDGTEGGLKQAPQRDSLHLRKPGFLNLTEISLSTLPTHRPFGLFFKGKRLGGRIPRGSLIEFGSDKHCLSVSLTIQVVVASGCSRGSMGFLVFV